MNIKLLKNAKAIVSCDSDDKVYYNSDVLIENNKIIKIEKNINIDLIDGEVEVIDCEGKFVYPGLINTHHHFFQAFARNLGGHEEIAENASLVKWLTRVYQIFQKMNSDSIYYSSLVTMADLIKHGCTTAFDLNYCFTDNTRDAIDRQMEAAKLMGIRLHAGRGTNTVSMKEGSMIPDAMCETTEQYIEDCKRVIAKYHDTSEFSMNQIVMAPCQPMNCHADTFTETVKLARENNVRMHTHMYEGEANIMLNKFGKRTFDWLEDLDFVGPDVWIAHGWEIKPEEYEKFGKLGVGVSYCPAPATMSAIGEIPNMSEMIKNDMTISIGCDGQASNDGSNILDSLRLCYVMQMNRRHETGRCIAPYEILKMATVNGAKTLGRDDIGSLEVGKAADLFMIDTNTLELAGALHDPKSIIMTVGLTGNVWLTMINGKVVYSDGKLAGIDEVKLAKEAEAECTNSLRKQCPAFEEYHLD